MEDDGSIHPPSPEIMSVQKHLEDRLKNTASYQVSEEEIKTIKFEGIETYIFRKLSSKKFRKTKIDEDSEKRVKEAIKINIDKNEPIKFTYPFGGYKIWRVESYPYVDWAEFFTISYVLRYIAPIASQYKPGVEFYFSSDDVCIELIDNYPRESLDKYINSFKTLLSEFSKHLPDNISIELKQVVPDIYGVTDYKLEYKELFEDLKEQGLTLERKAKLQKYFDFNFLMNGKVDYSDADDKSFRVLIDNLMFWSEAYLNLKKRKDFVRGDDKIVLFSQPISNAIDIGANSTSKAKFWAGLGALELNNDKVYERIMSPKQWDDNKEDASFIDVKLIDLPNFNKIPVFNKRFDFVNS